MPVCLPQPHQQVPVGIKRGGLVVVTQPRYHSLVVLQEGASWLWKVPKRLAPPGDVANVLAAICPRPATQGPPDGPATRPGAVRDDLRLRRPAGEVWGLYVEDLDLRLDDEHVRIHGKDG